MDDCHIGYKQKKSWNTHYTWYKDCEIQFNMHYITQFLACKEFWITLNILDVAWINS